MVHHLGGKVRPRRQARVRPRRSRPSKRRARALSRACRSTLSRLDVARRRSRANCPPASTSPPRSPTPSPPSRTPQRRIWAVQFHPEVHHTPPGHRHPAQLRLRHLRRQADLDRRTLHRGHRRASPQAGRQRPRHLRPLRRRRLLGRRRARPPRHARDRQDRLTCIFVNNGVLRKNEFEKVQKNLRDKLGLNIVAVDASERFLDQLAGVTDPEAEAQDHRQRIHRRLRRRSAAHRAEERATSTGWCRARSIPTSSSRARCAGPSQIIKSHHNVGGLPENMKLKLIEPLRDLFKDEVRRIGRDLGMPEDILAAPALPRPGPRRPHPRRSHRRARRTPAGSRRHRRRRDQGRRPLPARSGSPSPCCCR